MWSAKEGRVVDDRVFLLGLHWLYREPTPIMSLDGTVLESRCGDGEGGFFSVEAGLESPACRSSAGEWVAFHALPEGSATYLITTVAADQLEVFVARPDGSDLRRLTFNDF